MVKRFFVILTLFVLASIFWKIVANYVPLESLGIIASHYVSNGLKELGATNLVTAVIVTFRGLDTLGEIVVLFISATGVGVLLRHRDGESKRLSTRKPASSLVQSVSELLVPLVFLLGVYIFVNGHLTPGGGFQGGAVIASGVMLLFLAYPNKELNHKVLAFLESLSGFSYVLIGIAGLLLAGGFLDNRFLSLGKAGEIFSAGAIPLIYILIGIKVGTELSVVLEDMREE